MEEEMGEDEVVEEAEEVEEVVEEAITAATVGVVTRRGGETAEWGLLPE